MHIVAITPRSRKLHVASTFQGTLEKTLSDVTLNVANIGDVDDGKFKRRRKVNESPIAHVILPLILIKKSISCSKAIRWDTQRAESNSTSYYI